MDNPHEDSNGFNKSITELTDEKERLSTQIQYHKSESTGFTKATACFTLASAALVTSSILTKGSDNYLLYSSILTSGAAIFGTIFVSCETSHRYNLEKDLTTLENEIILQNIHDSLSQTSSFSGDKVTSLDAYLDNLRDSNAIRDVVNLYASGKSISHLNLEGTALKKELKEEPVEQDYMKNTIVEYLVASDISDKTSNPVPTAIFAQELNTFFRNRVKKDLEKTRNSIMNDSMIHAQEGVEMQEPSSSPAQTNAEYSQLANDDAKDLGGLNLV